MSGAIVAGVGVGLVSAYMGSKATGDAADKAAGAQGDANAMAIAEQQRQFDAVRKLLAPYVTAGTGALTGQQNLIGLGGADEQRKAIAALEASPEFGAYTQQGENAILSNASATGGLRGGNTQAALAQFRPQLLAQLINQQYERLGGLTSLGQNAAAGVGNAGLQTGANISNIYGQTGAANAGAALAAGQARANNWANVGQAINTGIGAYGSWSGRSTGVQSRVPYGYNDTPGGLTVDYGP